MSLSLGRVSGSTRTELGVWLLGHHPIVHPGHVGAVAAHHVVAAHRLVVQVGHAWCRLLVRLGQNWRGRGSGEQQPFGRDRDESGGRSHERP